MVEGDDAGVDIVLDVQMVEPVLNQKEVIKDWGAPGKTRMSASQIESVLLCMSIVVCVYCFFGKILSMLI